MLARVLARALRHAQRRRHHHHHHHYHQCKHGEKASMSRPLSIALRRGLQRQTGRTQCVLGGVAAAPWKDKRFGIFLRDGATFFVMISLLVNCRNKPSTCGPFFITSRSALRRQTWPTQRFFAAWPRLFSNSSFFGTFCNDAS